MKVDYILSTIWNVTPYLPGRGRWVFRKAHGLDWWLPLHTPEGCHSNISPSGRVYVIICCTGGTRPRGPCPFLNLFFVIYFSVNMLCYLYALLLVWFFLIIWGSSICLHKPSSSVTSPEDHCLPYSNLNYQAYSIAAPNWTKTYRS